jgi:chitosanase
MDTHVKDKIRQVVNAFETGSAEGNYGAISVFEDAPGNVKQYTVGRSQTTESGLLRTLLQKYVANKGQYSQEMKFFADKIQPHNGRGSYSKSIYPNKEFEKLFKKAASDPVMRMTQDEFFAEEYWNPAFKFFTDNGFKTPLAMLVIYDTAVHSGPSLNSPKSMMTVLRKRFNELPPVKGGNEKKWVAEYVNARHNWLANHSSRPILRKTIYRTNTFKKLIAANNWDLAGEISANGVKVRDRITTTPSNIPQETPKASTIIPPTPIVEQKPKTGFWAWVKSLFV